jgi:hypothetical protein
MNDRRVLPCRSFFDSVVRRSLTHEVNDNMILITPEERVSNMEALLHSIEDSIRDVRKIAQDLKQQIEAGEDADLVDGAKQLARADGLVRTCQKVEANLVELHNRQTGIVQGGYALDLEQARTRIGCQLARLRRCCGARGVSE